MEFNNPVDFRFVDSVMERAYHLSFIIFIFMSQLAQAQAPENPAADDIRQIFPASAFSKNYIYHFKGRYEEITIPVKDYTHLHAILFHADKPKGVIFYLHGNTGALDKWGKMASAYTVLGYDIFMLDYRGYGKSEGNIKNEKQLYSDIQTVYDSVKSIYPETNIIILGYSIGTGLATELAAANHPRKLILQAPYYSLPDAVHFLFPSADTTNLPFQFNTYRYLPAVACPVVIFHGNADKTFYYGSSLKLKQLFKPGDELITLHGAGHADMEKNPDYLKTIKHVLTQ